MRPEDWLPIEQAERMKNSDDDRPSSIGRQILAWMGNGPHIARWNTDQYNRKPRPYWDATGEPVTWSRAHPPTHFQGIVAPGPAVEDEVDGILGLDEGEWSDDGVLTLKRVYYMDPGRVFLALLQCGDAEVTEEEVQTWTPGQLKLAAEWAISVSYSASDNDNVEVPPRPDFIPRFAGGKTTVIGKHSITGADRPD